MAAVADRKAAEPAMDATGPLPWAAAERAEAQARIASASCEGAAGVGQKHDQGQTRSQHVQHVQGIDVAVNKLTEDAIVTTPVSPEHAAVIV
jgi:hypothetical protein